MPEPELWQLDRIERSLTVQAQGLTVLMRSIAKLADAVETLAKSLTEDEDEERPFDLDGQPNGKARDQDQPL